MSSIYGAIPKKPQSTRTVILSSSDSENGIDGNKSGDFVFFNDKRKLTSNKKLSRSELDDDSLDINEEIFAHENACSNSTSDIKIMPSVNSAFVLNEHDIEIKYSEKTLMEDLNEMMSKYANENIYDQPKDNMTKASQSAAEIGRAAMAVVQYKSRNNVDLTESTLNKFNKNICDIPQTIKSAPKVIAKTKPSFTKSNNAKPLTAVSKKTQATTRKRGVIKCENEVVKGPLHKTTSFGVAVKPNTVTQSAVPGSKKRTINQTSTSLFRPAVKKVILANTTRRIKSISSRNALVKPKTKLLETAAEEPPIALPSKIPDRKSLNLVPECPVCFEQLLLHKPTVATICGHLYCRECIDAIQVRGNQCPICRVSITQIIDLHI